MMRRTRRQNTRKGGVNGRKGDADSSAMETTHDEEDENSSSEEDDYQNFALFGGRTTPAVNVVSNPKKERSKPKKHTIASEGEDDKMTEKEQAEYDRFVQEQKRKYEEIDEVELKFIEEEEQGVSSNHSGGISETVTSFRTTPAVPIQDIEPPRKRKSTGSSSSMDALDVSPIKKKNTTFRVDPDLDDVVPSEHSKSDSGNDDDNQTNFTPPRETTPKPNSLSDSLDVSPIKSNSGGKRPLTEVEF